MIKNQNKIFGNPVNPAKQQISMEKQTNTLDKWMDHIVYNIHNCINR
jgi:hypothetical protein